MEAMVFFGPKQRVSTQSKKNSKIMKMSRKELLVTQSNMRGGTNFKKKAYTIKMQEWILNSPLPRQHLPRNNLATSTKSVRKSNGILEARRKDTVKTTAPSLKHSSMADEKQKTSVLLMSKVDVNARSKDLYASKKDGRILEISPPTRLKAMAGLAHKAPYRLMKRPISNQGEDIIAREAKAKKLKSLKSMEEFASNTTMTSVPNKDHSNEGKERQDGAYNRNDMNHIGEGHAVCAKLKDTQSAKESQSLTLSLLRGSQHMEDDESNSRNNSSDIGTDLSKCRSDKAYNHSMGANLRECNKRLEEEPDTNDEANEVHKENTNRLMKNDRGSRGTNKNEYEEAQDHGNNFVEMKEDVCKRTSHAAISHDDHMVPSCEQQCQSCSKPIDKPTWRGIFKMDDKKYAFLAGHLSSKSCEKVWSLSRQLRPLVAVKKLPRSMVWPKAWQASKPNGDNIGLYFLPHDMRQDKDVNQLVKEVIENDLALQAIIGEAEMLIFPSSLLPNRHQTFQGKHYLWGIFKPRTDEAVGAEPLNKGRHAHEVEMEKQQHVSDQQDETGALRYASVHSTEAGPDATAAIAPNNNGQTDPTRMEPPTERLTSLVLRQTPEVEQLIREVERKGALVFAVQGDRIDPESWLRNMAATAVQK